MGDCLHGEERTCISKYRRIVLKTLYIVHCVDTEGPMTESLISTFERLFTIYGIKIEATEKNLLLLQNKQMELGGIEESVSKTFSASNLKYNQSWVEIDDMLDRIMSKSFRNRTVDDFGNGWIYSWHCKDLIGYSSNPRMKDVGFGNIHRHYKQKIDKQENCSDEINWHFHPLSFNKNPTQTTTSYLNCMDELLQILCHRIIDENYFPASYRPGFHAERPDSHTFLEQWIPFDYANQNYENENLEPDLIEGRIGDWRRSSSSWRGYHPSNDDYQIAGNCKRIIFRCLNIGTRHSLLGENHVRQAFVEAKLEGSAILSFTNHDYREMAEDIDYVRNIIEKIRVEFPEVKIAFSGSHAAAISHNRHNDVAAPKINIQLSNNLLEIKLEEGELFGPQPFLAIKTKNGVYFNDNLIIVKPNTEWKYFFDQNSVFIDDVEVIGVASAGRYGNSTVEKLNLPN